MTTHADKAGTSFSADEDLSNVSAEIMFRLFEVNSMVNGCLALVEKAEDDLVPDNRVPQEITDLFYLLGAAHTKLMEHCDYVDSEFARLRSQ